MPAPVIINGIFTKDFPPLGRAILSTDIIIIAVAGDPITYRSTVADLNSGSETTLTGTADGSGNVDLSSQPIPLWCKYALYGGDGNNSAANYNGGTRMITGMTPGETYHFTY